MSIIFVVLLVIIGWLAVDFYFGRRKHRARIHSFLNPSQRGDAQFHAVGTEFFAALFEDLKHAKSFIFVQFYIVRDDPLGKELLTILKNRAADGVEVYLLVDAVGSRKLPSKTIEQLKDAGIFVALSERPRFPYFFYSFNRRNHRKITIIDSKIGYVGGFNVGEEYLGRDPKLGQWRDYHLRLTGDVVESFFDVIKFDWKEATGESLFPAMVDPDDCGGDETFQLYATNGKGMANFFHEHIEKAERSIFIGTPYFIPGRKMVQALTAAVKRGVRVTILIPMKADHAFVKEAAFPYLLPLLHVGVEVYRYYPGFYHAKVMMIDRKLCNLGTANFDKRSFYLNDEVNCLFDSPALIHEIEKVLEFDIQQSERLTLPDIGNRSIIERGKEMFALSISRFL